MEIKTYQIKSWTKSGQSKPRKCKNPDKIGQSILRAWLCPSGLLARHGLGQAPAGKSHQHGTRPPKVIWTKRTNT